MSMPLTESLAITRNAHGEIPVSSGDDAAVATAAMRPSYTLAAAFIAPDVRCPITAAYLTLSTRSCATRAATLPFPESSTNSIDLRRVRVRIELVFGEEDAALRHHAGALTPAARRRQH